MSLFQQFHWQPNIKILLFVAVFLPLTVCLGFWQLERAEQKELILQQQAAQSQLPPMSNFSFSGGQPSHLRRVSLNVDFDPERYLLLANRSRESRVGYEVIGVASLQSSGQQVLVNRGWVPASLDRSQLPVIEFAASAQVNGYYYCPQPNRMISQSTSFDGAWPAIVFDLDAEAMQSIFADQQMPPCEVRVDIDSPIAFTAGWQIVNQTVAKHVGYAVQWFLMALALIILALFSNSNLGALLKRGS